MSPALLNKYLKAAHEVASHMFLKPRGFAFAPYPMLVETDRDKYCVQQIIDFYHRQDTDYADYFQAAWRFKHRAALGKPKATLADIRRRSAKSARNTWRRSGRRSRARRRKSARWSSCNRCGGNCRRRTQGQPGRRAAGCEQMRDYVIAVPQESRAAIPESSSRAGSASAAQPFLIWKNCPVCDAPHDVRSGATAGRGRTAARPNATSPNRGRRMNSARATRRSDQEHPRRSRPGRARGPARPLRGGVRRVLPRLPRHVLHGGARPELFRYHQGPGRYLSAGFHN